MNKNTKNLVQIFKTLAEENRLKILLFIYKKEWECKDGELSCQNETCIKDLSKALSITIPTISHHIKELVNAGLITTKKEGRWVYCKINQNTFRKSRDFLNRFLTKNGRDTKKK